MGFLAPGFLAAAACFALPLWLHLLRHQKATPLRFSSVMFFERRLDNSAKPRRLDHLLLLALRLLLLALLVFTFAQPFISKIAPAGANDLKLIVVDVSASMSAGNRMERAKREAQSLVGSFRKGQRAQLAALDSRLHVLAGDSAIGPALASLRPGGVRGSYAEFTHALRSIAETEKRPVDVHLFSDMQRSSMPPAFKDLALPANVTLQLHPVADGEQPNWAVESVTAPGRLGDPRKFRITAVVAGFHTAAATLPVELVVNGRTIAAKSATVPAGGRASVEFIGLDAPYGLNRCEVRVNARDAFSADDRFHFGVERGDPAKILFVSGPRAGRARLYFDAALRASAESAYALDPAAPPVDPAGFAFVVLNDPGALELVWESALLRAVRNGLSVWIVAGPAAAARGALPLTKDAVTALRYASRTGERFLTVADADESHPSLRRGAKWEGVRFFQAVETAATGARVLARLNNGMPLLYEKQIGQGRVLVLASPLDNIASDFPSRPVFVSFVKQTADYLSGAAGATSSQIAGVTLDLRPALSTTASTAEVIAPDGTRALSLEESVKAATVELAQPGFYEVRRAGVRKELAAVNIDRAESDLALIPAESLALWQGRTDTPQPASEPARSRQSLSWPLLCAALATAMAESFVASRHLTREPA